MTVTTESGAIVGRLPETEPMNDDFLIEIAQWLAAVSAEATRKIDPSDDPGVSESP